MPAPTLQAYLVALVQSWAPPGGTALAYLFSALGAEHFYLLVIPCLLWHARWEVALKAARVMVLTDLCGAWIKYSLLWPRPDPPLARFLEPSPGFVSTHAALSMAVALVLASGYPRARPWLALWALGVAWSRLQLGVHFPLDILGGWAVAAIVAALVLKFGEDSRRTSHLSIVLGLFMLAIWPEGGVDSLQRDLGLLLGFEGALLWRLKGELHAPAPPPIPLWQGFLRLLLILALYVGLKELALPRLLRYAVLGIAAAYRSRRAEKP